MISCSSDSSGSGGAGGAGGEISRELELKFENLSEGLEFDSCPIPFICFIPDSRIGIL